MLTAHDPTRAYGSHVVLRDLDLRVVAGTRLGIVGPNGAGKTTLLELLAGDDEPDAGTVTRVTGVSVGYARQDVTGIRAARVLDAVVAAADDVVGMRARLAELERRIPSTPQGPEQDALLARYGMLADRFANASGYSIEARARKVLAGLGFSTTAMDADIATLSGGWTMRVALARLLLTEPDVLLVDEPTNHLDFDAAEWLATYLAAYDGALVAVSHDRWFLDRVVTHILELDGSAGHELYTGNYSAYVVERAVRRQRRQAAADAQAQQIAQTEAFIERFRAKASKARQVQSRVKALDRLERIPAPDLCVRTRLKLTLPTPTRSGRDVARLHDVVKRYAATTVFDGLDMVIERGATVAVVGPNGAGKSTLLRLLAGLEAPDAGTCELGHAVRPAYFAQHQADTLDADRTVLAEMVDALGDRATNPRSVLGAFGFPGDTVDKRVGVCSGGERARLALARLVVGPANLLCLDEPTNHLDLDSRELLTDALVAYQGTVVLVTHDRALIRATADQICGVGEHTATMHDGDLDAYLARRTQARGGAADQPTGPARSPGRIDRREQRRIAAEQRRRTQGLREAIAGAEAELELAEQRLAQIEAALAAPETYEDPEAGRELSIEHAVVADRVADAEQRWERLVDQMAAAPADT